jgi:hypothetical protein
MKRPIENLEATHTNIMSETAFSRSLDRGPKFKWTRCRGPEGLALPRVCV